MSKEYAFQSVTGRTTPRQRRLIQYLLVGAVGVLVNEGTLLLATGVFGVPYLLGGFLGQVTSISTNYALNDAWTWNQYGDSGFKSWLWRGVKYASTRVVGIGIHLLALAILVEVIHLHYLLANLLAIGIGFAWGFGASDVWVWNTETNATTYLTRLKTQTRGTVQRVDRKTRYVIGLATLLFVFYAIYTILLYRGYWITGGDFGSYVHAFETTKEGIGFMHTGRYRMGNPTSAYWGEHFSLTIFLVYPIYHLFPAAETLFVVKSVFIAASIPLLWVVARQHLPDRLALLVVLSYSFNPFLIAAWIFDFQEQIFLPVLLFGAYYCYYKHRYYSFIGLLALTLLTNEFLVIILLGSLAGFILLSFRAPDRSLKSEWPVFAVILLCLVATHLLAGHVISQYNEFSGIPTIVLAEPLQPFIESQRVAVSELVVLLIEQPTLVWDSITENIMSKAVYLVMFFVPVGFLALFDELSLASIAPFVGFAWLFSGSSVYYTFGAHYPLYLLPFLYIGAIRAFSRLELPAPTQTLLTKLFVAILVLNAIGTASAGIERQAIPDRTEHMNTLDAAIESIPEGATLVTQNEIYPHVADRPNALFIASEEKYHRYRGTYAVDPPEYILFDTQLESRPEQWAAEVQGAYRGQLGDEYGLLRYEDGIWIFKHGYEGDPQGITKPYLTPNRTYTAESLSYQSGSLYDHKIVSEYGNQGDYVWFGPYDSLPPGTYTASFLVNVDSPESSDKSVVTLDVSSAEDMSSIANKSINSTDGWERVNVTFTLDRYESELEFRGRRDVADATIAIRRVDIRPVADVSMDQSSSARSVQDETNGENMNSKAAHIMTTDQNRWMKTHKSRHARPRQGSGDQS